RHSLSCSLAALGRQSVSVSGQRAATVAPPVRCCAAAGGEVVLWPLPEPLKSIANFGHRRLLSLKQKMPLARAWGERHSHAVPPKITRRALRDGYLSAAVTGRPVGPTGAGIGALGFTLAGGFPRAFAGRAPSLWPDPP